MGIFPGAQGQLTPQSLVRSGRISNSFEILWMSSLPASMKKIRSKMKALEWTQHFPHYNSMVAMETSGRIWPNFELIQALIHVLITCKYEKIPIKTRNWLKARLTVYPPQCAYQNPVNLSKIIFSALNFFMHIFNMSVIYLPSIKRIH